MRARKCSLDFSLRSPLKPPLRSPPFSSPLQAPLQPFNLQPPPPARVRGFSSPLREAPPFSSPPSPNYDGACPKHSSKSQYRKVMFLHSCKTNLRLFRRADEPSQITYSLKQSVVDSVAVVGELLQRTDSGIARGLREPHGEVRMSLAGFRVCAGCRV